MADGPSDDLSFEEVPASCQQARAHSEGRYESKKGKYYIFRKNMRATPNEKYSIQQQQHHTKGCLLNTTQESIIKKALRGTRLDRFGWPGRIGWLSRW